MIQRSPRLGLLCALLVAAGSSSADAQTITYGPHAANYRDDQGLKVPEVEVQVENEWLASSENDTFRSPTSRVDGGKILYDFCPPGTTRFPTDVELWVKSPAGAQLLSENPGFGYTKCKGEFQVPWSKAVYELRAYENYSHNGGKPKTLIATKEVPYAAPWVVILGDSYSSGEGAPEIRPSGLSDAVVQSHADNAIGWDEFGVGNLEWSSTIAGQPHGQFLPQSLAQSAWRRGGLGPQALNENACHRSSAAWGFRTTLGLQKHLNIPLDVSLHACSGAVAFGKPFYEDEFGYAGTLGDQLSILDKQIQARGQAPDVVLFTFGGNDFKFSDIVATCMKQGIIDDFILGDQSCDAWFRGLWEPINPFDDPKKLIAQYATGLPYGMTYQAHGPDIREEIHRDAPDKFDTIARILKKVGSGKSKVFVATYPSAKSTKHGDCILNSSDINAASEFFLEPLNHEIRNAAARNGLGLIELEDALDGNGYCTENGWFHDMGTSYATQGDPKGTFHPNAKGHSRMAQAAIAQLQGDAALENHLRGAVYDLGQDALKHFLPDDKEIVLTGGAPFNERIALPIAKLPAESTTILSDRFFLDIQQLANQQIEFGSKLGISIPLQTIEVDGQPYDPTQGVRYTAGNALWQSRKIKIRMFRQNNMTPYARNTFAGRPMAPEIPPVEFSVLQVSPEVFDQQIKMWLVDPVSGVEIRQDLLSLLSREGPPARIGGGWIGGVEARFELPKEASVWLSRRCGDVNPQDPKAFFPNIQERVALRANTSPVSGPSASWSVFDGDFYDEKAPLNQQTCWKNVPGGQPQSALLDLHVDLPGVGVLHGKRPIHVSVAPDTEHWQTAVDLALDIDGEGTRWAVCDASFQDFLQDGYIHDGSAIQGCVSYKAPLHAGTTAVDRLSVACDNTRAYACLHENKGFSPGDLLKRRWLNLSAVPFPVWTGFGDHGRSIEGVHVEVDGMPVQAKTLPWDRDIWPSDRIVLTHPSLPSRPIPAHGTSLPEYNGSWLFQQQLPPGPHRLEVYACLNKQAACSDSVAIKQEPQIVQERGYARVLDTSFEAP